MKGVGNIMFSEVARFLPFCARFTCRFLFVFIPSSELSLKPARQLRNLREYAKRNKKSYVSSKLRKKNTFLIHFCNVRFFEPSVKAQVIYRL